MTLRIAVVQQNGNFGRPAENRQKALDFAAQALDQKAQVILFHEELLVGYVDDPRPQAESVNGQTTRAFIDLLKSRQSDALIIYGLTERDGKDYYIAAPVVSAQGVVVNYRKTHLWWKTPGMRHEPTFYRSGDRLVTFDAQGHRCGLMICYDGDFPEMTRSYAQLGCSVVFWMNNRLSRGNEEVRDLARRNSMILATSCCCGVNENGDTCRGGSNITAEHGRPLAEIWDREGVIVADVDPDLALRVRQNNPWFNGLRPELYAYSGGEATAAR
jgi:(R)-amidase